MPRAPASQGLSQDLTPSPLLASHARMGDFKKGRRVISICKVNRKAEKSGGRRKQETEEQRSQDET